MDNDDLEKHQRMAQTMGVMSFLFAAGALVTALAIIWHIIGP